jgi:hypothetical protein
LLKTAESGLYSIKLTVPSEELPDAIDQFTPDRRLSTEQDVSSRWV